MFHPALFNGANVVVTGAGRGIGLEIARQLLDCGAHVLLHGGRAATRAAFILHLHAGGGDGELRRICHGERSDLHRLGSTAQFGPVCGLELGNVDIAVIAKSVVAHIPQDLRLGRHLASEP